MMVSSKLERLFLAVLSRLVLCLQVRSGDYPKQGHNSGRLHPYSQIRDKAEKDCQGKHSIFFVIINSNEEKCFMTWTPGYNLIHLFKAVTYERS
jgi:hypothetical protein